jgi:glucose-6-phosphate 1-epimerase
MDTFSPPLILVAPDGARAEIYPHGAHVASWVPAGGTEHLFLSPASELRPGAPIRGGVPVIFPQFSGLGTLTKHGFVRLLPWDAAPIEIGSDFAAVTFMLSDNDATRQLWPQAFRAEMRVWVGGQRLEMTFSVVNTGDARFTFTAALHTYFQVADVLTTTVEGLAGTRYHDTTVKPWAEGVQSETGVSFPGEVDRIYYAAPSPLFVRTPERSTRIETQGFPDGVVWNPGPEKCARLPDMQPDGYRSFVCVEAAAIGQPISLPPGSRWQGTQILIAE